MPSGTANGIQTFKKALSGNALLVKVNNVVCGYVQTITATDDYAPEALSGIGDIHVVEWVPTQARYTIQVDRMVLIQSSLMTVAGGASDGGGGSQGSGTSTVGGKGVWEDGYQMMQGFIFDIEAVGGNYQIPNNKLSDNPTTSSNGGSFKKWFQCSFAQGQVTVTAHRITVERATFYCTQVSGNQTVGASTGNS